MQEGNQGEWVRSVVRRFEAPLIIYASRILRNEDLAQEVVQDTFLKLCHQPRSKVEPHLAAWLYRVCRNRSLDVLRKEKRLTALTDATLSVQTGREDAPDHAAESTDETNRALGRLAELPDPQQDAIRMKFQRGMSYKQIAAATGHSVGYVGYLIHMGIKALRQDLSETPTEADKASAADKTVEQHA